MDIDRNASHVNNVNYDNKSILYLIEKCGEYYSSSDDSAIKNGYNVVKSWETNNRMHLMFSEFLIRKKDDKDICDVILKYDECIKDAVNFDNVLNVLKNNDRYRMQIFINEIDKKDGDVTIKYLLENGVEPNLYIFNSFAYNEKIIDCLFNNCKEYNTLHNFIEIIQGGNLNAVKYFINNGYDPKQSISRWSCFDEPINDILTLAILKERYDVSEFLVDEIVKRNDYYDFTNALSIAVEKHDNKTVEMIINKITNMSCIDTCCNINYDINCDKIINHIINREYFDTIKIFIKGGANVDNILNIVSKVDKVKLKNKIIKFIFKNKRKSKYLINKEIKNKIKNDPVLNYAHTRGYIKLKYINL
jgi:hypothetical protein